MLATPSKAHKGAAVTGVPCEAEVDAAEIARRWRAQRSQAGERAWFHELLWDAAAGLREEIHFYRTKPYVIGEHLAYELAPGLVSTRASLPSGTRALALTLPRHPT